jgi:ribose 5-phosphate isomerase A
MATQDELKRLVGEKAAELVQDGTVVGLGTGSTVFFTVKKLGQRVKEEGLDIIGISTSEATSKLANELGIKLSTLNEHPDIAITIDGADEVDPNLDLIKGMGGALLWEKIVASCTEHEVIIVDGSKMVNKLGTNSPLPVEVLPFGWIKVQNVLKGFACDPVLRKKGKDPYQTDSGNFILDCRFNGIDDPVKLEASINNIPGVVENGLFLGIAKTVFVGRDGKVEEIKRK